MKTKSVWSGASVWSVVLALTLTGAAVARGGDVLFSLQSWGLKSVTNRSLVITPIELWPTNGQIAVYDRVTVNSGNGVFWVSNMMAGIYQAEVQAPPSTTRLRFYVTPVDATQNAGVNALAASSLGVQIGDVLTLSLPGSNAYIGSFTGNLVGNAQTSGLSTNLITKNGFTLSPTPDGYGFYIADGETVRLWFDQTGVYFGSPNDPTTTNRVWVSDGVGHIMPSSGMYVDGYGNLIVQPDSSGRPAAVIKAKAGQSAALLKFQDSTGVDKSMIDAGGKFRGTATNADYAAAAGYVAATNVDGTVASATHAATSDSATSIQPAPGQSQYAELEDPATGNSISINPTNTAITAQGELTLQGSAGVKVKESQIIHGFAPFLNFAPTNRLSVWTIDIDQAAAVPERDFVPVSKTYAFGVDDGALTNGQTGFYSKHANFTALAVGFAVSGPGVVPGTTIASVVNASNAVLSAAATATATGVHLEFTNALLSVIDEDYWSHNGFVMGTLGIGVPQPPETNKVTILGDPNRLDMGALHLRVNPGQTAPVLELDATNKASSTLFGPDGTLTLNNSFTTTSRSYMQGLTLEDNSTDSEQTMYSIVANPIYSGVNHTTLAQILLGRASAAPGNYDGQIEFWTRATGSSIARAGYFDPNGGFHGQNGNFTGTLALNSSPVLTADTLPSNVVIRAPDGSITVSYATLQSGAPALSFSPTNQPTGAGWSIGIDQSAPVPNRDFITVQKGYTFSVSDGAVTNGSTGFYSAQADFSPLAVGFTVAGTGIPAGTTISSVLNASNAVMSAAATNSLTGVSLTFSRVGYSANSLEYWSHNGFGGTSKGIGVSGPDESYRLHVASSPNRLTQGTLNLRAIPGQTGTVLNIAATNNPTASQFLVDGSAVLAGPVTVNNKIIPQQIAMQDGSADTDAQLFPIEANANYSGGSRTTTARVSLERTSTSPGNYDGEVSIWTRATGGAITEAARFDKWGTLKSGPITFQEDNNPDSNQTLYDITANPVYSGTGRTTVAKVSIGRASATPGNYGGEFDIWTRPNGGSLTKQLWVPGAGGLVFSQRTSLPAAAEIGGAVGSVTNIWIGNVNGAWIRAWSDSVTVWSQEIGSR